MSPIRKKAYPTLHKMNITNAKATANKTKRVKNQKMMCLKVKTTAPKDKIIQTLAVTKIHSPMCLMNKSLNSNSHLNSQTLDTPSMNKVPKTLKVKAKALKLRANLKASPIVKKMRRRMRAIRNIKMIRA